MKDQRFWLLMNGHKHLITIPGEYVESVMMPSADHEAGHIIAAHHLNARVLGIALGFLSEGSEKGIYLQARYSWKASTVENRCVVKAAGRAADILLHGAVDDPGNKRDLEDIEKLTGRASFEPFLDTARNILSFYESEFRCIRNLFRDSLERDQDRTLEIVPGNCAETILLGEEPLIRCLSKSSS